MPEMRPILSPQNSAGKTINEYLKNFRYNWVFDKFYEKLIIFLSLAWAFLSIFLLITKRLIFKI